MNQILSCHFHHLSSNAMIVNKTLDLAIEMSSFSHIKSTGNGGSIFAECRTLSFFKNCFDYSYANEYGVSMYVKTAKVDLNFTSIFRCPESIKMMSFDAWYFHNTDLLSFYCNSSSNQNEQSCGIQGNNTKSFKLSFFIGTDGSGWCSAEFSRHSIDLFVSHSIFVNNTIKEYGVIYMLDSTSVYLDSVIISNNIGNGVAGSGFHFTNCFYYSKYPLGVASTPSGLSSLDSPSTPKLTEFFPSRDCYYRRIEAITHIKINALDVLLSLSFLSLLFLINFFQY